MVSVPTVIMSCRGSSRLYLGFAGPLIISVCHDNKYPLCLLQQHSGFRFNLDTTSSYTNVDRVRGLPDTKGTSVSNPYTHSEASLSYLATPVNPSTYSLVVITSNL